MSDLAAEEQPIVISAEHLEPVPDTRIELERGMSYAAWLTITLAALCVIAFLWELTSGALADEQSIVSAGALERERVLSGELWRLFSSMFLHGGADHLLGNLLGNLLALYVLGMACEHVVGMRRMGLVYLLTGTAGGLLTMCLDDRPTVGASGAIFGLLGFLAALLYRHRKQIVVRENRIVVVLGVWAAYQLLLGFFDPLVANWAHIGGLLSGVALALVTSLGVPRWEPSL